MLNCTLQYAFTSNYIVCLGGGEGRAGEMSEEKNIKTASDSGEGGKKAKRRAINEMKHGSQPSDRGEHCNVELDVSGFCVKRRTRRTHLMNDSMLHIIVKIDSISAFIASVLTPRGGSRLGRGNANHEAEGSKQ
jgi:hypothetical protein